MWRLGLTREELLRDAKPEEVDVKILVAKDSWTKSLFAHAVEKKGTDEKGYVWIA